MSDLNNWKLYVHVNKTNGKMYFGITCNPLTKRFRRGYGYRGCPMFASALKKYGWDGFNHILIYDNLSREEAEAHEKRFISICNTTDKRYGYNIQSGGMSAGGISEEGKRSMREKKVGLKAPNKRSVVVFNLEGNKIDELPVITFAAEKYDVKVSTLLTHLSKGRGTCNNLIFRYKDDVGDILKLPNDEIYKPHEKRSLKTSPSTHPVTCFSPDGKRLRDFPSIAAAQRALKGDIRACLDGSQKTAGGYIFKYSSDVVGITSLDSSECFVPREVPLRGKPVCQYDMEGNFIESFPSIGSAAKAVGVSLGAISACLRHKSESSGGFKWEYGSDLQGQ